MSKIVHTEFISKDSKATADFVEKMFGWQIKKWDDPKGAYYLWNYPGQEMGGGGIGGVNEMSAFNMPHISIYIDVDNIAKSLEKAQSLGAKVVMGETAIGGGMGHFAIMSIPGGCNIGIWAQNPSK